MLQNDSWQSAENLFGAAWEASVLPVPPLDIQVTNTKGEEVILKCVLVDNKTKSMGTKDHGA